MSTTVFSDIWSVFSGKKRKAPDGEQHCKGAVPHEVATSSITRSDEDADDGISAVTGVSAATSNTRTAAFPPAPPEMKRPSDKDDDEKEMILWKELLHYIKDSEESRKKTMLPKKKQAGGAASKKKKSGAGKNAKISLDAVGTKEASRKANQAKSIKTKTGATADDDGAIDSDEEQLQAIAVHGFVNEIPGGEERLRDCWMNDHFMKSLNDFNFGGIIVDSYEDIFMPTSEFVPADDAEGSSPVLLQLNRPELPTAYPAECNDFVEKYLSKLKTDKHQKDFENATTPEEMIKCIQPDHLLLINPKGDTALAVKEFLSNVIQIKNYQRVFDTFCRCHRLSHGTDGFEVVLGLIHVRHRFEGSNEMINGPLLELLVKIELTDNGELQICAADNAKLQLNKDVLFALDSIRGGDTEDKLLKLLGEEYSLCAKTLFYSSDLYKKFFECARWFDFGTELRYREDKNVHRISDHLVLNEGWCFFCRPHKSTVYSRDAWNILGDLQKGNTDISNPIRELLGVTCASSSEVHRPLEGQKDIMCPLPATKEQKAIVDKIVRQKQPVTVITGAPGTGKTHTIANIAMASLSKGLAFASVSNNPRACQALVDRIPPLLRPLCLDMSACKNGSLTRFVQDLEVFIQSIIDNDSPKVEQLEKLSKALENKKAELSIIDERLLQAHDSSSELLRDSSFKNLISTLTTKVEDFPLIFKTVMADCCINEKDISEFQCLQMGKDYVVFNNFELLSSKFNRIFWSEDLMGTLDQKEEEASESKQDDADLFVFSEAKTDESTEALSSITVGGRNPETKQDWRAIKRYLELMKRFRPLIDLGYRPCDMFNDVDGSLNVAFINQMKESFELKKTFDSVKTENGCNLLRQLAENPNQTANEVMEKRLELLDDIEELERSFVQQTVLGETSKRIGNKELTTLQSLLDVARRINSKTINQSGEISNDKQRRLKEEFDSAFKEAAPFMPFLVMTTEQVSSFLPPSFRFDVVVVDEASQSGPAAILVAHRGHQLVVVGDGKQSSPSTVGLSEERIEYLRSRAPKIPASRQLRPDSSFFDLYSACSTRCTVRMTQHFRCRPELIRPSNDIYYNSALIPVRESCPTNDALQDVYLENALFDRKGVNEKEASFIAEKIFDYVKRMAESTLPFMTIGVISLSTEKQALAMEHKWKELHGRACNKFGSDLVRSCNIRFGVPSNWQGDERDIIFLSATYSSYRDPSKPGKKFTIKADTEKARRDAMNVALSRSREHLILVRSYGLEDLSDPDDLRRPVLEQFNSAGKQRLCRLPKRLQWSKNDWAIKSYKAISAYLESHGFVVGENKEQIWHGALRITNGQEGSPNVLVLIVNSGEDKIEFEKQVDEQLTLQRVQRPCIRVDFLSLVVDFTTALAKVVEFLSRHGLEASPSPSPSSESFPAKHVAVKCDLLNANTCVKKLDMEVDKTKTGGLAAHSKMDEHTDEKKTSSQTTAAIPPDIQSILSKSESKWLVKDYKTVCRHKKQAGDRALPCKKDELVHLWDKTYRKRLTEDEWALMPASKKAKR